MFLKIIHNIIALYKMLASICINILKLQNKYTTTKCKTAQPSATTLSAYNVHSSKKPSSMWPNASIFWWRASADRGNRTVMMKLMIVRDYVVVVVVALVGDDDVVVR